MRISDWSSDVCSSDLGSLYWHIDGTMNDVPILASLLSMKQLPSTGGGDTEFCNTYAAYDDLSEADKAAYSQLKAMHSAWNTLFYYDRSEERRVGKECVSTCRSRWSPCR